MSKNWFLPAYRWIGGLLVALFVLVGIYRTHDGILNLFDGRGQDRVEAGDEVGELSILSTRHLVVRPSSVLDIVVGFSFMLGSVAAYKLIENRLTRTFLDVTLE